MRIALRTSGGRGEYELAGTQGDVSVPDLFDRQLLIELIPGSWLATRNTARRAQGKPRIRLSDPHRDSHIYLILAAALLLPKPKRELSETSFGNLQVVDNKYSIISIPFDIVRLPDGDDAAVIRPTDLVLANFDDHLARVDVIERMDLTLDVWREAQKRSDALSLLVQHHQRLVHEGRVRELLQAAEEIRSYIHGEEDPLRQLLRRYDLTSHDTYVAGIHTGEHEIEAALGDEDPTDPWEATGKALRHWRKQAARGAEGQRFREQVTAAYSYTCLFTGHHFPPTPLTKSAGVEAAHILPWAEYNLNIVQNGICLDRTSHWAFDAGVLRLDYGDGAYRLSIPRPAALAESRGLIDLSPFHPLVGTIPPERLPSSTDLWPNPDLIRRFNQAAYNS